MIHISDIGRDQYTAYVNQLYGNLVHKFTTITLYEIHDADGVRFLWILTSKRQVRIRAMGDMTHQYLWTALSIRSNTFRCFPGERCGSRTIFKTEFIMGWE